MLDGMLTLLPWHQGSSVDGLITLNSLYARVVKAFVVRMLRYVIIDCKFLSCIEQQLL